MLAMGASLFTGCGSKPAEAPAETTEETAETTEEAPAEEEASAEEITLKWAAWDVGTTDYYQALVDAYEAQNENVKVELVDFSSADYMTVLATQLAGGADDLDVITIKDMPGYSNLINLEMLEPLNDYHTTDASLYGGTIEQISLDGTYYQVPFRSDFWVLYYNKDLFDAAGVDYPTNDMTLDEYDELARSVTSGEGADAVYGAHYHTWRSAVQLFGVLDGANSIVDGTYDFLQSYYERILAQQQDGIVMDYATLKTSSTHYSGVFYNQQVATMNMGSWFIPTLIETTESGENLAANWGIAKYPHPDGVEAGTTLGTITGLAINSKSAQKEAAADFLNFVTGEEGAALLAGMGTFPAIMSDEVIDTISSVEGFPQDETSKEALSITKTYLEMPVSEYASDIETVLNAAHDNIMTENVTIEEGIQEMNDGVGAIINQ